MVVIYFSKAHIMKDYGTISQAINKLKSEEGYSYDFNMEDDHLAIKETEEKFKANDFEIDKVLRFEGFSNPSDNSILYAISTSSGRKGILLDGYGVYGGQVSKELLEKLKRKQP